MKAGLRTYILAGTGISAVVAARCYSFPAPQNATQPYIMLTRVSSTIQNLIGESLNIYDETWQVDIIAPTDKAAESLAELVITRLNIADRVEMGNYTVYACSLSGITEGAEIQMPGGETREARKTLDFRILRNREVTPPPAPPTGP